MITVIPNATEQNLRIGADDTGDFIRAATQMSAQREANQAALVQQARQRVMELQDRNLVGGFINPQTKQVTPYSDPSVLKRSEMLESNWSNAAAANVLGGERKYRPSSHGYNIVMDPGRTDAEEASTWVQELSASTDPADVNTYQKLNLQPGYTGAQAVDAIVKNASDVSDAVRRRGWIMSENRYVGQAVPGSMLTDIFEKPYGR